MITKRRGDRDSRGPGSTRRRRLSIFDLRVLSVARRLPTSSHEHDDCPWC